MRTRRFMGRELPLAAIIMVSSFAPIPQAM